MIYGVKNLKGKIVVEPYENEKDIPLDFVIVKEKDLQDFLEKIKKGDFKNARTK